MSFMQTFREMDGRMQRGYLSLIVFLWVIATTLIVRPPIPIQTVLITLAITIMIIGNTKIQDLIAGVILHPIMAMSAGFLVAGAMELAGGFDALIHLLNILANNTPLGLIGVAVILVNIPTIMPMPCGRILAIALLPGVIRYGNVMVEAATASGGTFGGIIPPAVILPALVSGFIVNAAASCGPSPLGGVGGIGEGNLGVRIGSSGSAQSAGIMMATGLTAMIVAMVVTGTFI